MTKAFAGVIQVGFPSTIIDSSSLTVRKSLSTELVPSSLGILLSADSPVGLPSFSFDSSDVAANNSSAVILCDYVYASKDGYAEFFKRIKGPDTK